MARNTEKQIRNEIAKLDDMIAECKVIIEAAKKEQARREAMLKKVGVIK